MPTKLIWVTAWLDPYKTTKTVYGEITNIHWIQLEKERLKNDGFNCLMKTNLAGRVALAYWHQPTMDQ